MSDRRRTEPLGEEQLEQLVDRIVAQLIPLLPQLVRPRRPPTGALPHSDEERRALREHPQLVADVLQAKRTYGLVALDLADRKGGVKCA